MSKAIVFNDNNLCPYLLDDGVIITITDELIEIRNNNGDDFNIGDMNLSNATVYEGATAPSNWVGNRYTYDGTTWTEVDGWVNPIQVNIDRLESELATLKDAL